MSYSSTLTIAELNAQGSGTLRVVTLIGPSLPLMGASWKGSNKLVTTWYPGNPTEATQQNLGPRLMPSRWTGEWRRTMMGVCPTLYSDNTGAMTKIVDPSILRDQLEAIFTSGRRLRVTWSTQQQPDGGASGQYGISGSIVREGRVAEHDFKHRTIHDITWEIEFDWVSRGGTTTRVASTRDDTLTKTAAPYAAAIQGLIGASQSAALLNGAPSALTLGNLEGMSPSPLDTMTLLAGTMVSLQNNLVDIAGIGGSLAQQPIQVVQMSLSHAANSLQVAQDTYQGLSGIPVETMSRQNDAVSVLGAYALFGPVQDQAQSAEIAAYAFYQSMRKAVPTHVSPLNGRNSVAGTPAPDTILGTHVVRDHQTPQRISQIWYGTPDHAADIMRANGLPWYQAILPTGKQLIVPVIPSSTQTV